MKKIVIIFSFFSIVCISCEDFLVKDPLDRVTDIDLTFTANQCKLYVNQFYTNFPNPNSSGYIYIDDRGTDNLYSSYNYNPDLIAGLRVVPSSGGGWSTHEWEKIRDINYLLDNYTKSTDLETAEKYVAEARFFRAFFYFEQFLTKFGGVPWIENALALDSEELKTARLKRNELADRIIEDLNWAIDKLPSFNVQAQGRISKEVAQLYKARVALYEATWEKYHSGTVFAGEGNVTTYFQIARDASDAVISSGLFALDNVGEKDGYFDLFNRISYESSKEVMLWKDYSKELGIVHGYNDQQYSMAGGGVGLSRWLVESYLCADGKPISISSLYKGDANLLTVAENRDPRLGQTMGLPGRARQHDASLKDTINIFIKAAINKSGVSRNITGYELVKGVSIEPYLYNSTSEKATIIFRYTEALLIYAEARAELDEITQDDLDKTVNRLRDRVGMPHLTMDVGFTDPNGDFTAARGYDGVPVSNLLQEIRRERRVEFACEGYRMNDLKRWRAHHLWNHDLIQGCKTSQFEDLDWLIDYFNANGAPQGVIDLYGDFNTFINDVVAKWDPAIEEGLNYWTDDEGYFDPHQNFIPDGHFSFDPSKSYLSPIPTQELLLNPNLKQNPGWE